MLQKVKLMWKISQRTFNMHSNTIVFASQVETEEVIQ